MMIFIANRIKLVKEMKNVYIKLNEQSAFKNRVEITKKILQKILPQMLRSNYHKSFELTRCVCVCVVT